ncbi:MAG: hypothetical protein ACFFE8_06400 [Candidatus Heimdallarchaeota archaeon]
MFKEEDGVFGIINFETRTEYVALPEDGAFSLKQARLNDDEWDKLPGEVLSALLCRKYRDRFNAKVSISTVLRVGFVSHQL